MSWESLADIPGNPTPIHVKNLYDEALIVQQELNYHVHRQLLIAERDVPSLNTVQLTIFTTIMSAVDDHKQYPKVFLSDGPGGSGKIFFFNILMVKVRSQSKLR